MARKAGNTSIFDIDKTSFFWTMKCGACHPGAGPGKFDRDGNNYWDATDGFGYENLPVPKTADDVYNAFDGDYTFLNPGTRQYILAPWDRTGVSETDCLMCHLDGYSWFSRTVTLGAGPNLFGVTGYRAFEAAATAGAGWVDINQSAIVMNPGSLPFLSPSDPADFAVNYGNGILAGTLMDMSGNLAVVSDKIVGSTLDANCRNCHATPDVRKMGRSWEDNTDVHKAAGVACVTCHPAGENASDSRINTKYQHDFAKGDSSIHSTADGLDNSMANCEGCHVNGQGSVSGSDPTARHDEVFKDENGAPVFSLHFAGISCEGCHIPYKEDDQGTPPDPDLLIDMSADGTQKVYSWSTFFGLNPVTPDPTESNPTGRWYPSLVRHNGKVFVAKPLVTIHWGEWNGQMGGAEVIEPYPLWQVRQALSGVTLTDDAMSDGIPEVNTEAEIKAVVSALKTAVIQATDRDSATVTQTGVGANPVLVTGSRVFYVDDKGNGDPADDTVEHFESSAFAEPHDFSIHHNVQPKAVALGAGGCTDCHATDSPFFFRKQMIDPWEFPGDVFTSPNYVNAWEILGYSQTEVDDLTTSVPAVTTSGGGGGGSSGCALSGPAGLGDGIGVFGILLLVVVWFAITREREVTRK